MKPINKILLVIAGYMTALVGAVLVAWVWVTMTDTPPTQASSGMHAFGDMLLLIGSFGVLSLAPTALAIYFWFTRKKTV